MELSEDDLIDTKTIIGLSMRSVDVFIKVFPDLQNMTDLQNMKLNEKLEREFKKYFRNNHKNIFRDRSNFSI